MGLIAGGSVNPVWLVIVAFLAGAVPMLVGVVTSYLKISIVLGMLRSGLGAQQVPGQIVVMALSMALTMYIMGPTIDSSIEKSQSLDLTMLQRAPTKEALMRLAPIAEPWRAFMTKHAGARELRTFAALAAPETTEVISADKSKETKGTVGATTEGEVADPVLSNFRIVLPAFVITEVKEAFAMGFVLLLPFLVIDLIVANLLVGLGMTMVSPTMISLPLKLALFVVADGWLILAKGLISSYGIGG